MKKYLYALIIITVTLTARLLLQAQITSAIERHPSKRATDIPFVFTAKQQGAAMLFHIGAQSDLPQEGVLTEQFKRVGATELNIYDANDHLLWHETKSISMKHNDTHRSAIEHVNLFNDYTWDQNHSEDSVFTGIAEVRAYNRFRDTIFDTTIVFEYTVVPPKPLTIHLNIERQPDQRFLMNMQVTRVANVKNEFLPSGLTHDYLVYDANGNLLWQMSKDKMYTQVLTEVQPKTIGEHISYTDVWNGDGNVSPGAIQRGRYKLIGVIPCKPAAVGDSVYFFVK